MITRSIDNISGYRKGANGPGYPNNLVKVCADNLLSRYRPGLRPDSGPLSRRFPGPRDLV